MRILFAPAAMVAGVVLSSAALSAPAADSSKTIIVSPPDIEAKTLNRTTEIGAPVQRVDVSQTVSFDDLDLSNPADLKMLRQRISATAVRVCRDLRAAYPPEFYPKISGGNCVDATERRARSSLASLVKASTSGN